MVTFKRAIIRGKYKSVRLSESEEENVLNELLDKNFKELERCTNKVLKEYHEHTEKDIWRIFELKEVVKLLFEKQAKASFTALSEEIDKKIAFLNERENEMNDFGLGIRETKGDSQIEKIFNKIESEPNANSGT